MKKANFSLTRDFLNLETGETVYLRYLEKDVVPDENGEAREVLVFEKFEPNLSGEPDTKLPTTEVMASYTVLTSSIEKLQAKIEKGEVPGAYLTESVLLQVTKNEKRTGKKYFDFQVNVYGVFEPDEIHLPAHLLKTWTEREAAANNPQAAQAAQEAQDAAQAATEAQEAAAAEVAAEEATEATEAQEGAQEAAQEAAEAEPAKKRKGLGGWLNETV